jgi:hypothetical protein
MPQENRMVPIQLAIRHFSTLPEDIDEGCCPACKVDLDLSQPDSDDSARMLGICNQCGRWYVIDLVLETGAAVMVLLPDVGFFEDALANRRDGVGEQAPANTTGRPAPSPEEGRCRTAGRSVTS